MRPLLLLILLVLCTGCASPLERAVGLDRRGEVPFLEGTPPPPRVGSAETRRQVEEILELQSKATPMRIASARWTYDYSVFTYSLALGPSFTAKKYPATARFFLRLNDLVEEVNDGLKDHFRSPHPFQVDARVKRFVIAVPGFDYPSYHSARCAVFERVLGLLDPARADAFRRVSERVEEDRVFAGEHFPYSIAAGRALGARIFAKLESNATFQAELEAVRRSEWQREPSSRDSF